MATVSDAVMTAFFAAAVPEEVVKFFVLWLLLRRSRYFDERMDGIVYAVFVSLGFAALENFMYLFGEEESVLSVGISRALFAVPAHFGFGILMGYFYSMARFCPYNRSINRAYILIAPILAHGLYDAILFALPNVAPIISGGLTIVFIVFCWKMWKQGSLRIQKLLNEDFEA
jgi:RsiW-degrading membrane proteinase PrsW (M82 family)